MFFFAGLLVSIITFPGVIVHELAHQLFCRWFGVPVFKVCYFQVQNPVGYVVHEPTSKNYQSILIATGPFFINTIVGLLIAFPSALHYKLGEPNLLDFVLMYFGVSIAMHAFPSTGDAASLWRSVKDTPSYTKILVAPIVGFIYLGAIGSMFWLDLAYGIAVCVGLPYLLVGIFA